MGRFRTLAVMWAILLGALGPAVAAPRAAPDFELELFNGETFRLGRTRGTAVILLFWAPW